MKKIYLTLIYASFYSSYVLLLFLDFPSIMHKPCVKEDLYTNHFHLLFAPKIVFASKGNMLNIITKKPPECTDQFMLFMNI